MIPGYLIYIYMIHFHYHKVKLVNAWVLWNYVYRTNDAMEYIWDLCMLWSRGSQLLCCHQHHDCLFESSMLIMIIKLSIRHYFSVRTNTYKAVWCYIYIYNMMIMGISVVSMIWNNCISNVDYLSVEWLSPNHSFSHAIHLLWVTWQLCFLGFTR